MLSHHDKKPVGAKNYPTWWAMSQKHLDRAKVDNDKFSKQFLQFVDLPEFEVEENCESWKEDERCIHEHEPRLREGRIFWKFKFCKYVTQ